jgi:hypothetical protein
MITLFNVTRISRYMALYIDKGKGLPLQTCTGPDGFRNLRFPDFKTTMKVVRLLALRTGRLYT